MISTLKSLKSNTGFMKYFKNTSWLFGEKILRIIVGLFVGTWVARYLGPEQFGLFSYVQSFVGIFAVVATLGLDSIVVRELVKKDYSEHDLIGTAFWLKLLGAAVVLILLSITMMLGSNGRYTNLLICVVASSVILQSFNVIDFYFQSKVLSKYTVFSNVISLTVSSILKIILILKEAPLEYFVYLVLFDSIILALGYLYFYSKKGGIQQWSFNKDLSKKMLKDSYPLIIGSVINSIYMKIDQIMIKEVLGVIEVGYYAAAVRLSEVWFAIGVIVSRSLFPAIINAKKVSESLYYERIQRLFLFLVSIAYILSIVVFFLSDYLILFLYGKDFVNASSVLSIHIFSAIFVYLGVSSGRWIINENKSLLDMKRNFLGMLGNIGLNAILIPRYGIIGAAYASLVAYILAFYIFDLFYINKNKMFLLKTKALFLQGKS